MSGLIQPGSAAEPSPQKILVMCKKVLSCEEDEEVDIPSFLPAAMKELLTTHPNDTELILEFARESYGIATCMEQGCYSDIRLTEDPNKPDGGKNDMFGSLACYYDHCENDATHIRERDKRIAKERAAAERRASGRVSARRGAATAPSQAMLARQASPESDFKKRTGSLISPQRSQLKKEQQQLKGYGSVPPMPSFASMIASPSSQQLLNGNNKRPATAAENSLFGRSLNPSSSSATIKRPRRPDEAEPGAMAAQSSSEDEVEYLHSSQPLKPLGKTSSIGYLGEDTKPLVGRTSSLSKRMLSLTGSAELDTKPVVDLDMNVDSGIRASTPPGKGKGRMSFPIEVGSSSSSGSSSPEMVNGRPKAVAALYTEIDYITNAFKQQIPEDVNNALNERLYDVITAISAIEAGAPPSLKPIPALIRAYLPGAPYSHAVAAVEEAAAPVPVLPNLQEIEAKQEIQNKQAEYDMLTKKLSVPNISPEESLQMNSRRQTLVKEIADIEAKATKARRPNPPLAKQRSSQMDIKPNAVAGPSSQPVRLPPTFSMPGQFPAPMPGGFPVSAPDAKPGMDLSDGEDDPMIGRFGREVPIEGELGDFFKKSLDSMSELETVDKAREKLELESINDRLPGMNITLMPHQVIGVAKMLEWENTRRMRGGILGDAMGLGKTVQALSVIAVNPSEDKKVKTTLIVAPLSLLTQWESEINTKCSLGLDVLIFHGPSRPKKVKTLQKWDVVLTTYGTLAASLPKDPKKKKKKRKNFGLDDPDFIDTDTDEEPPPPAQKGPLHRMVWHRVILDECHIIRNKTTQAAKACYELDSTFRWCLTGSLIVNSLTDIYSPLHFLGITSCADWTTFQAQIGKVQIRRPRIAARRAQKVLNFCMLRRHKESEIDGKRILNLPQKSVVVANLDFDNDERTIYEMVERRARIRFNRFLKQGTVLKNYSVILTMLMRLRQVACHPILLARERGIEEHPDDMRVVVDDDEPEAAQGVDPSLSPIEKAMAVGGEALVNKLKKHFQQKADNLLEQDDEEDLEEDECPICYSPLAEVEVAVTSCCHEFCLPCLSNFLGAPIDENAAAEMNEAAVQRALAGGIRDCPCCRDPISMARVFPAQPFRPVIKDEIKPEFDDGLEDLLVKMGRKRTPEPNDEKPDIKGKGRVSSSDDDEAEREEPVIPSTKMKAAMEMIERWTAEEDNGKIICFSQFTTFLDLMGRYLAEKKVKHLMYKGSMSRALREESIRTFQEPNDIRVILVSSKAGSTGLNLTIANKVILLDQAWNASSDQQAIDRSHRIGQTRPVEVQRLVIRDSVDERMMSYQDRKEQLSNGALGEGEGARAAKRLTVKDLAALFGMGNHEDSDEE